MYLTYIMQVYSIQNDDSLYGDTASMSGII